MKMSNASCLLLLVVGVLAAAAVVSAHPRQHDPCKWNDFHGWTFVAETGEELDEEAMKKLPEAYIQYGWRHYRSGKCSYKGWEQRCPDYWHEKHGGHHFEEHWWDTHFSEAKCNGAHCLTDDGCCSHNCNDGYCCPKGTNAIDEECKVNSKCCSGQCTINDAGAATAGKCCIPTGSKIKCAKKPSEASNGTEKCCDGGIGIILDAVSTPSAICDSTTLTCCRTTNVVCANSALEVDAGNKLCCSGKCKLNGSQYTCAAP